LAQPTPHRIRPSRYFNNFRAEGAGIGVAALEGMLKRLGLRLLDLIDSVPMGWLIPTRQPIPVRTRRRHPFAR
jgi:hypothetical protein